MIESVIERGSKDLNMGPDIVDIALSSITDFIGFERLATEVLQLEGFPRIKPLGLRDDKGVDAMVEKYYEDDQVQRTVFQYTTQEYLVGKINDTIEVLSKNGIEFKELIIVTNRPISTPRIDKLKESARKDEGVRLDIFEYRTFHARLSDLSNGLFVRHFPDIDQQVAALKMRALQFSQPENAAHEMALLRTSCALSFHSQAPHVRRSVFDNLTLAVLSGLSEEIEAGKMPAEYKKCVAGLDISVEQISASLGRLIGKGLATRTAKGYSIDKMAAEKQVAAVSKLNELTKAMLDDVVNEVETYSQRRLSIDEKRQVYANTRNALTGLFRFSGLDLIRQVNDVNAFKASDVRTLPDLIQAAKQNISDELGEIVVGVLADIISQPTKDQADLLAQWCRTFMGAQLMQLDPMLNEFQSTKLSGKVFLMDTDVVLDAIVNDTPRSAIIVKLVKQLAAVRCRVVVTTPVLEECIEHAKHSGSTYDYFGVMGVGLSPAILDERVNNVFVKGYFYALQNGSIPRSTSFKNYLSNYLEASDPVGFFKEVIDAVFGESIDICSPEEMLKGQLDDALLIRAREVLLADLSHSRKSAYRTEDQNRELAETDAKVFTLVYQLNQVNDNKARILGSSTYLVTETRRFTRTAVALNIADRVSVLPKTLAALLENISGTQLSSIEVVQLFENPFLTHAVESSWHELKSIVEAGIDTCGKKIQRLRRDVSNAFHDHLTAFDNIGATTKDEDGAEDVRKFGDLVSAAKKQGYAIVPEVAPFVDAYEKASVAGEVLEQQLAQLKRDYSKLEDRIEDFGRRKRRYLQRVAHGHQREGN